jgi:hypothetical protein
MVILENKEVVKDVCFLAIVCNDTQPKVQMLNITRRMEIRFASDMFEQPNEAKHKIQRIQGRCDDMWK